MPQAGDLKERVTFQRPVQSADEYGNTVNGFASQFDRDAMYIMRPGSEALQAARLEGRQPVTIVVRYDSETKTVTPDWRLQDVRTGRVFEVKAADDMERRRQWWSMTCEALR